VTSERRLIIEPSDILSVEFVCKQCGASLGLNPAKRAHFVKRECPNCREEWLPEDSVLYRALRAFFGAIQTLSEMEREARVSVRLHLRSEPPDKGK